MNRPKVVLQVSSSIDGRISFNANETMFTPVHESLQTFKIPEKDWIIFNEKVKSLHNFDFFLEGSNMLISENSEPKPLPPYIGDTSHLYQDYLPENIVFRKGRKTWTSVVDGRGRFRNGYKAYLDNPESYMIHLTSYNAPPEYLAFLQNEEIPYLLSGEIKVDLKEIMRKLYEKLKVRCILTSSGGKLGGAILRENLLDEVNILFNPFIYGGENLPVLFKSPDLNPPDILPGRLKYLDSQIFESGAIWLRYKVE